VLRHAPPHLLTDITSIPIIDDAVLNIKLGIEATLELCGLNHQFALLLVQLARAERDTAMTTLALVEGVCARRVGARPQAGWPTARQRGAC
jgi:hypothetical protein